MVQEHTAGGGRCVWSRPCRGGIFAGHEAERVSGQRKPCEPRDGDQRRRGVWRKGEFPRMTVLEREREAGARLPWAAQMSCGTKDTAQLWSRGPSIRSHRRSMPPVPYCTGPAEGGADACCSLQRNLSGACGLTSCFSLSLQELQLGCNPAAPATSLL